VNRPETAVTGERADLLETLVKHRYFLRHTVRDLTDEQAQRTTVSELCLGGLIKHVAFTERQWINFILDGSSAMDHWEEESLNDWSAGFRMLEGETLAGLLDEYEQVARRDRRARGDAARSGGLPPATRGSLVRAGRALVGTPSAAPRDRGDRPARRSRDIIRESLDGAKSMG
jgi:Protein of unknown function (DUF664)